MDRNLRPRPPPRRSARPHSPSRPYPRNERRQLPAKAKPPQTESTRRSLRLYSDAPSGEKALFRYAPEPLLPRKQLHHPSYYWLPFSPPQWFPFFSFHKAPVRAPLLRWIASSLPRSHRFDVQQPRYERTIAATSMRATRPGQT